MVQLKPQRHHDATFKQILSDVRASPTGRVVGVFRVAEAAGWIDRLVYEVHGLTDDEISIFEAAAW